MSDKKWYKLVFKQLQPLHIGEGSYGVINETRIFIPGWTMWGALTKAYNIQCNKGELSENQRLFEEISCFYPCFVENGESPLLPNYKDGEFHFGEYSEDEFRAKFVNTYVSTAIMPGPRMAKDKTLHEINIILPGAKAEFKELEEESQLYWVGILNIEEDKKNEFLRNDDLEIIVGGDSRYGLGKMALVHIDKIDENSGEFKYFLNANYIPLKNNSNAKVELIIKAKGYDKRNLKIENPRYCYVPDIYKDFDELTLKKGGLEANHD